MIDVLNMMKDTKDLSDRIVKELDTHYARTGNTLDPQVMSLLIECNKMMSLVQLSMSELNTVFGIYDRYLQGTIDSKDIFEVDE